MPNTPQRQRGSELKLVAVNILTCSRAPLVLLFLAGVIADLHLPFSGKGAIQAHDFLRWANLFLLAASSITDLFDGLLARKWNVTSQFGAICDPLMDKVFFVTVFPVAASMLYISGDLALGSLALAFTVLFILRDLWVVTLRSLAAGKADMKANFVGKTRTALGFPIGIVIYCRVAMGWDWLGRGLIAVLLTAGLLLNIYSAFAYTRRFSAAIDEAIHTA